jgi:hypothetical protein
MYACNPSAVLSPNQKELWVAYRQTNVAHASAPKLLWNALRGRLETSVALMRVDAQTFTVIDSHSSIMLKSPASSDKSWIGSKLVKGLHDPRLSYNSKTGLYTLLAYTMVSTHGRPHAEMQGTLLPQCVWNPSPTKPCSWKGVLTRLVHQKDGSATPQKNWNIFPHDDGKDYVVTRVLPHEIGIIDWKTGAVDILYSTTFQPLADFAGSSSTHKIHGGTSLVRWNSDSYMAACHVKTKNVLHGNYQTMLYLCEAQPPFAIRQVTQPFGIAALNSASVQMVTGMVCTGEHLIMLMGIQDQMVGCVRYPRVAIERLLLTAKMK